MPFQKAIETPITGAEANYHVVASYTADLTADRSVVVVHSYFSAAARAAGRQAMHTWHISLIGVPPSDAPALRWFEEQLAAVEVPDSGDPSYNISPDRWVLAGAVIL